MKTEDYKFVYKIQGCEHKLDFDTNTIVDKILSTRAKQVDEEVIKQLRNIGEERGINELILIDESKVLNLVKAVRALEIIRNKPWLVGEIVESKGNYKAYKSWCSVFRTDMKYRATKEEFDLLKEVLL